MLNIDKIDQKLSALKEQSFKTIKQQREKWPFEFVRPAQLANGVYQMRFLYPMPQKNPSGCVLLSTHRIEHDSQDFSNDVSVLSPFSIEKAEEKCDLIMRMLVTIDKNNIFDRLPAALKRVVGKMNPWNRLWFPILLWAREIAPKKEGEKPSFVPLSEAEMADPNVKPLDLTLELNANIDLVTRIRETWRADPNIADEEQGRNVLFGKKGTTYSMDVLPDRLPIPETVAKFVADNYPDLTGKMRQWHYKSPSEIANLVSTAWWAPAFRQMGFKLEVVDQSLPTINAMAGVEG